MFRSQRSVLVSAFPFGSRRRLNAALMFVAAVETITYSCREHIRESAEQQAYLYERSSDAHCAPWRSERIVMLIAA